MESSHISPSPGEPARSVAVEPDGRKVFHAPPRPGLRVVNGYHEAVAGRFDAVAIFDVLYRLPRARSGTRCSRWVRERLAPGGVFLLKEIDPGHRAEGALEPRPGARRRPPRPDPGRGLQLRDPRPDPRPPPARRLPGVRGGRDRGGVPPRAHPVHGAGVRYHPGPCDTRKEFPRCMILSAGPSGCSSCRSSCRSSSPFPPPWRPPPRFLRRSPGCRSLPTGARRWSRSTPTAFPTPGPCLWRGGRRSSSPGRSGRSGWSATSRRTSGSSTGAARWGRRTTCSSGSWTARPSS